MKLKEFTFDLIVYDESEYFRDYNDPEFFYPYIPRKSVLSSFKLTLPSGNDDYDYIFNQVKFQRSEACLEGSFMEQVNFMGDLYDQMMQSINDYVIKILEDEEEPEDPEKDKCGNGVFFRRLKLAKSKSEDRKFSEFYDKELLILNQFLIMHEVQIN